METKIRKRVEWVDVAKAIGIVTVIIGHSVSGLPTGIIYSFHMVLFFLLSAYTGKYSKNWTQYFAGLKKYFVHLIVPAIICFVVKRFIMYFTEGGVSPSVYIKNSLLSLLYSSANSIKFDGYTVPAFGMMWFLVVLFWARELYDALQLIIKNRLLLFAVTLILSFAGVYIGRIRFLFFSFDITLAVLILFCIAHVSKNRFNPEDHTLKQTAIYFILWVLFVTIPYFLPQEFRTHLNYAEREYPLFPLCYIGAISATAFFSCLSVYFLKLKARWLKTAVLYVGRNTMVVLIIHQFDFLWKPLWNITGNMFVHAIIRLACDMLLVTIVLLIKNFIKKRQDKSGQPIATS